MPEWADFFVAEVGASAALAGLVIVAISINLARIIEVATLPARAAETLVAPTGVLVASSYMLVPHQPLDRLAVEILLTGAAMWLLPIVLQVRTLMNPAASPRGPLAVRFILTQLYALPILAAGVLLWSGEAGGVAWMVPGVVASLVATVINAWVLLVEILR